MNVAIFDQRIAEMSDRQASPTKRGIGSNLTAGHLDGAELIEQDSSTFIRCGVSNEGALRDGGDRFRDEDPSSRFRGVPFERAIGHDHATEISGEATSPAVGSIPLKRTVGNTGHSTMNRDPTALGGEVPAEITPIDGRRGLFRV